MRVLICGGGTGGHIYPALAAVTELQQRGVGSEQLLWIGTRGQMEETLVPRAGLTLRTIAGGPIVGVPVRTMMMNAAKLTWSMGSANRLMAAFRPDVLFLTGGYVNVPVGLMARLRRIPAAVYLPDIEPGSAIKFLLRLVDRVAVTTPASERYIPAAKMVVTGYPVRPELRAAGRLNRAEARARFELAAERPTLFVFGGSRGARSINRALLATLPALLDQIQVIHVSGELDWPTVEANAATLPATQRAFYRPYPYLHERMGAAYRAADLVLARAGASMLGEVPAFGLPAILVPYPHAWRYQQVNADYLATRGAAVHLADADLGERLRPTVLNLILDEARLADMSAAAHALDVTDSAGRLAGLLLKLGRGTAHA